MTAEIIKCRACEQEKSKEEFYADGRTKTGVQKICKKCSKDPEQIRKEKASLAARKWYLRNPGHSFRACYGINPEIKYQILAAQGFRCAACKSPKNLNPKKIEGISGWCMDHDHKTLRIRGVLCWPCNVTLGLSRDSSLRLQALASYLRWNCDDVRGLTDIEGDKNFVEPPSWPLISPGVKPPPKTHCKRGHPLSGDNLAIDRGNRRCKICAAVYHVHYDRSVRGRDASADRLARIASLIVASGGSSLDSVLEDLRKCPIA